MSNPKLNPKEESSAKKTRSPPKKAKMQGKKGAKPQNLLHRSRLRHKM